MPTQSPLSNELRDHYYAESARLEQEFSAAADGMKYLRSRSALLDSVGRTLWAQFVSAAGLETAPILFAAVDDLGRQTLFPYSDVNLLAIATTPETTSRLGDAVLRLSQPLNDLGLECAGAAASVEELLQFDSDKIERTLSLLDLRLLAGDRKM